jgi:ankyrin repeat protein
MSTPSVAECAAAWNNVDIDDDSLLCIFDSCVNFTALFDHAIRRKNARAVRLLLSSDKFDPSAINENECTHLHYAYECSSLQIIDMLLAAGLDIDTKAEHGTLPWHFAAQNPDETVMAHLIATGIDVNATDAQLWSLVHRAAAWNENENILAMLIAAGANVAVRDVDGNTPCHGAALNSNAAAMAMLIPLCDVNAVNKRGESPCMLAVIDNKPTTLELLIGAGANVNAVDNDGTSVGAHAVEQADEKVLELLVNADVDLTTVDLNDGANVLRLAVEWCNHRLVSKLIAAGCDVNATDENAANALSHAFQRRPGESRRRDAIDCASDRRQGECECQRSATETHRCTHATQFRIAVHACRCYRRPAQTFGQATKLARHLFILPLMLPLPLCWLVPKPISMPSIPTVSPRVILHGIGCMCSHF